MRRGEERIAWVDEGGEDSDGGRGDRGWRDGRRGRGVEGGREREGREKNIKLKENYALKYKDDDRKKKVKILSRAGEAKSKKWGRSNNVDTGEVYGLNLDEWEV